MDKNEYRTHFDLEERYWWFRTRRRMALGVLKRVLPREKELQILDGGCGAGINLSQLARFGRAFGFDFAAEALAFCRKRGLDRLARADANRLPYKNGSFDLVTFFDVIYHESIDDEGALRETARVLKTGGLVLVTDSAFQSLVGPHDAAMHGARRYDRQTLRSKLEGAGFEVLRIGYFFMTTFPAIYVVRKWERRRAARHPEAAPHSNLPDAPGHLNGLMAGLLWIEASVAIRHFLPVGSTIVALAKKK